MKGPVKDAQPLLHADKAETGLALETLVISKPVPASSTVR